MGFRFCVGFLFLKGWYNIDYWRGCWWSVGFDLWVCLVGLVPRVLVCGLW